MIELDVNIYSKDYYNANIIDCIHKSGLTKRTNNERFLKKLVNYYHNSNYEVLQEQTNNYQELKQVDEYSKY